MRANVNVTLDVDAESCATEFHLAPGDVREHMKRGSRAPLASPSETAGRPPWPTAPRAHSASWQQGYDDGDREANAMAGLPLPLGGVGSECWAAINVAYEMGHPPANIIDYRAGCRAAWAKHGWQS
jgi:hypothetical protein